MADLAVPAEAYEKALANEVTIPPEAYEAAARAIDIEADPWRTESGPSAEWVNAFAHAAVDAVWPLAVAEGRYQAYREAVEEVARNPLHEVWTAAIDATHSADFRDEDGELNEEAYLRYQRRVLAEVQAKVIAHAKDGAA